MKKLRVLSLVLVLGLTLVFTACSGPMMDDEVRINITATAIACESFELSWDLGPSDELGYDITLKDEEELTMIPLSLITDNTTSDSVEFYTANLRYNGYTFTFAEPHTASPILLFDSPIFLQNVTGGAVTLTLNAIFESENESTHLSALRLAIFAKDESFPDAYVLKGVLAPYEEAPVTYGIIEEGNTPASLANLPATTSLDLGILTSYQTREIVALLWLDGNEDAASPERADLAINLAFSC